jgi:phosphoribosylformylglycinamidine cyclo-ligase
MQAALQQRLRPGVAARRAAAPVRRAARGARRSQCRAVEEGLSYKAAGVDIDAGEELVRRIQKLNPNIGGFSGLVPFGDSYLVAGTDGVGTKLKLAFDMNKHDTVGIDLVAMSVNDIITSGAAPLFFLDYYATGFLDVDAAEQVIKGIVEGCNQSGCSLMGGETAEMPGFYQKGEYDLAGFAVGAVKKDKVIDGSKVAAGDVILGLPSSGIHSNGFSLVRKVLEVSGTSLHDRVPWGTASFGEVLLEPTVIYVKKVLELHDKVGINGIVHITGGGFPENIPRVVPKGMGVEISAGSWRVPDIFQWIQKTGKITDAEMRRTFNMGIGLVMMVEPGKVAAVQQLAPEAVVMGKVVEGKGVTFV